MFAISEMMFLLIILLVLLVLFGFSCLAAYLVSAHRLQ